MFSIFEWYFCFGVFDKVILVAYSSHLRCFSRHIAARFAVLFMSVWIQQLFNNQITDKCGCFTPALLRRRQDDVLTLFCRFL